MIPADTICVSQEGPANALALNKDCSQVVIAGRNVFKVFSIGENEFTEVCNLRVGKNLSLNFSSIDVAWSTIEENTLATAATNGAVVVWNLGRSGRSKQEHVFSDHKRTVNKVSFHLTEPSLLISGSQDGMMKCFDLRMKEVARTFISNTESIRDVQFSPHAAHTFAAVSENGSVQVWDVRRHERALQQFAAHSGPVFACDWHPDLPWLATASRDKTIKVWDMSAKPTLEHTIYTIASVGHVKWRPQRKYQVASCALVLDCAVHVWDVRRPHVPLATFAEHRDVTTAIAWQASPLVFLSTSRDCTLYRHRFAQAAHPVLWANPHAVAVSARGELAHARPSRPLPALGPRVPHAPTGPPASRKQPAAGALAPAAQLALERAFPGGAGSLLARLPGAAPGRLAAAPYRVRGAAPAELAAHNAEVARALRRPLAAHVWDVVRLETAARAARARGTPAPPPPPPPRPAPAPATPPDPHEEAEPETADEWADTFHNSGVLGMPTLSIYIPGARGGAARGGGAEGGWASAASAHFVDVDAAEWALPEEAFPLRAAPPPASRAPTAPPERPTGGAASPAGSSSPGSAPCGEAAPDEGETCGALWVAGGERAGAGDEAWDCAGALAAALRLHADLGDVQLPAAVLLVLQDYRSDLFPYIDEGLQEHWLLGYIEFLQRHKLYNAATEVVRAAWVGSVWALSQQSTSVALCCARCGRRARRGPCACAAPAPAPAPPDACSVCRRAVRGLYAWCQGCAHGGHLHHVRDWLDKHRLCPAGCGHRCTPP